MRRKVVAKMLRALKEKQLPLPLPRLLSDAGVDVLALLRGENESDDSLKEFLGHNKLRDVWDFFYHGDPVV